MSRIINPSSWPSELRLCVLGLILSFVVHGILWDLFRGSTTGLAPRSGKPLKLRLTGAELPVVTAPVLLPAEVLPDSFQAGVSGSRKASVQSTVARAPVVERAAISVERGASADESSAIGFRALNRDEGKIAYRLALFMAMETLWPELPAVPLKLELTFDIGGRLTANRVLQSTGEAATDLAWLRLIGNAVERAVLPQILASEPFVLELEILD